MSIQAFVDFLSLEKKYASNTVLAYQRDLKVFQIFLASEYEISDLKVAHYTQIRRWITLLVDGGLSNRSINRKISALNSFYKFLVKTGTLKTSPLAKHKALKVQKKIHIPFSEKEVSVVLSTKRDDSFEAIRNLLILELLYSTGMRRAELINLKISDVDFHQQQLKVLGKRNKERFIPLLNTVRESLKAYINLRNQPVFFGSALNNFGVKELLDCFIDIAPTPSPKSSEERLVKPNEDKFSGFVFKIHANMDPKHRNRLAFIKIVSGTFKRNTPYLHVRHNKKLKFSSPNAFFAEKKAIVDTSYPGDIVGLHDTGNFKIGDTLTEGETLNYKGIPSFSPEHFRYINNADPMKAKQLYKGIDQLMDEGVAQLFTLELNGRKLIGTVGALQYEVIQYRLEHEYGAKCSYENLNVHKAAWVEPENEKSQEFEDFKRVKQRFLAKDKQGRLVFLADSKFSLQMTEEKYPSIKFHLTSEF